MSATDLDVYSKTKFSNGVWMLQDNVSIDWATDVVKVTESKDSLYSLASTKLRRGRGDTLNAPTVSLNITTPVPGIIGVNAYHHLGSAELNEPRFNLNKSETTPVVESLTGADSASLVSGQLKAVLKTQGFGLDFVSAESDKILTKLGFRSLGYVRDRREKTDVHRPFMTAQLHLSVREKVYGLGERFGPLTKNGQRVEIWNADGGTSSEQAYKNIPFYFTNRGYGVLVDSSSNVTFEIQSERTTRVNMVVPGEAIRFYIIYGPTPKEILHRYCQLTGFPALPPAWTFGLWLSTSFTTSYDVKTVSSFLKGMKEREIPVNTFHFDSFWMKQFQWCDFEFDSDYFEDAGAVIKHLKKEFGVKVCVWINSYIAQESKLFKEASDCGYLIKKTNGTPYQTDLWQAGMGIVDFSNPDACQWYQGQLSKLMDLGVDSFKTDFGERIPAHGVQYYDGSDPELMHNYYTYIYNKCVFELLEKRRGVHEACLFARSATCGGQKFPVHWGGDCESTFEAMSESLRGGLSLTSSGFGFWSHDIGGFEGNPDPAVYKRWVAFGLLSSHSRLHGSGSYRVPWAFDDESSIVLKKFTDLKLSLMPYIYDASITAHEEGIPVMRAMYVEFPEDQVSWDLDTQFMLGSNLLVAPVFSNGDVEFYLPKGNWYGYLDGKVRSGGMWHSEFHDFKSLPLLVRENSIFVSGPKHDQPDYVWSENFTVNVYALNSEVIAEIPDHKKPGKRVSRVVARPISGSKAIEVTVEGGVGTWSVKVLGSTVSSVKGGKVNGEDSLGNAIINSNSKGKGTIIIDLLN